MQVSPDGGQGREARQTSGVEAMLGGSLLQDRLSQGGIPAVEMQWNPTHNFLLP